MTDPRYQDIPSAAIPEVTEDDGTKARIICGTFWGKTGRSRVLPQTRATSTSQCRPISCAGFKSRLRAMPLPMFSPGRERFGMRRIQRLC